MTLSTVMLIVLGVIVLFAVALGVSVVIRRRRDEKDRVRGAELREQAATLASGLKKHEAHARETDARAAQARAEAAQKQAEAERLEAEARDREHLAAETRTRHEESLAEAEHLDPKQHDQRERENSPRD